MGTTRRRFLLHLSSLLAATAADGGSMRQPADEHALLLETRSLAHFVDRLPIPPVARPSGLRPCPGDPAVHLPYYRISMRQFQAKVHRDVPPTTLWGYNSLCPGPTFEARNGKPNLVEWENALPSHHLFPIDHTLHGAEVERPAVRTVVHLHGGRTEASSDGYPEDWFVPGQSAVCHYTNQQEAASLFYHDHAMGITRLNAVAGLMGLYLLRDDFEDELNLPNGDHEIPLILFDRSFRPDGQIDYPVSTKPDAPWVSEYYGSAILANGKIFPFHPVEPRKYRLRLLNGSNGSFYRLSFSAEASMAADAISFYQIGSEQGFLSAPTQTSLLIVGPGERVDLIFDFSTHTGKSVYLRTDVTLIMQFRVSTAKSVDRSVLPATLRPVPRTLEHSSVRTRELTLADYQNRLGRSSAMLLNGMHWDAPATEKPVLGSTEIWSFINLTDDSHPIHLHLVRFQLLDRRPFDLAVYQLTGKVILTGPPVSLTPGELGWKDTVRVDPMTVTRIIVNFEGFTGRYVWHCHMLEHEDNEMMRPLIVTSG